MHMESVSVATPLLGGAVGAASDGFVIAEWQDAGGVSSRSQPIAPLHIHNNDDEAWYVLEGTLGVQAGDREIEARSGSAVFVPRGTPHSYWNAGAGRLRYLLVMTAKIHRLIQELHTISDRNPATMNSLFRKYDSELLMS